ncbi:polyphenol oxidase [Rhizobium rhizosphaerae]|uniref:Purine nucleoside phosphorylase n=1 Tax=Xaviernesmea rhizosphaerae TaxID=1672749 RepID=A0ABX3PIH9_9HYPH|nr:peptidoglycan editing factor PgeF [Xaviernesmea rhizosphaerae]OQP87709.1 polyphenol oxidase [Xaviernesmea rhizosphaerae]
MLHALSPVQSPLLAARAGAVTRHGFFTREGGVSEGLYTGLNVGLGSRDVPQKVAENRARVAAWFGADIDHLATVHQVHSPRAVTVDAGNATERPEADALVTATPGIVLGVLSADCGPILFCDPQSRVIGAAHAGWKGALTGVLESTIDAMVAIGAERSKIVACLGPSISAAHYEVGAEFVARFLEADSANSGFFTPSIKEGHFMFDLPAYTLTRLRRDGVQAESLGDCTYGDPARFFSYRRTTHAGEPDYGRQISAISLKEA